MKFFTIGYDDVDPATLISILKDRGVNGVADVRLWPHRARIASTLPKCKDARLCPPVDRLARLNPIRPTGSDVDPIELKEFELFVKELKGNHGTRNWRFRAPITAESAWRWRWRL